MAIKKACTVKPILPNLLLFNWQRPVVMATGLLGVQLSPFFSQGVEDNWNIFEWVWK
jgi:hypothetical protein